MGQHEFKLSLSVGTKLMLSIALLLVLLILFLNFSAIFILKADKQAYIFKTKTTEAFLAGKEFSNSIRHSIDTLRLLLANIDPEKKINTQQKDILNSIINNQSDIIYSEIGILNLSTGKLEIQEKFKNQNQLNLLGLTEKYLEISDDWLKTALPSIKKNGYGFINLSSIENNTPLSGILFADLSTLKNSNSLPISMGVISNKQLKETLSGLSITIVTRTGWVLYDSDPTILFSRKNILDDPLFQASLNNQLSAGTADFEFSKSRYLGSFYKPGFDLVILSRENWKKSMKATYDLIEKFAFLGGVAIGVGIIFAILFSKTLTYPINKLYLATQTVSEGNFNLDLKIQNNDEIGALTKAFVFMSQKINELFESQKEMLVLDQEIEIASTVQQTLIPPSSFNSESILIRSFYQSASKCGGDWWGVFEVNKKTVIAIADATGHGIPSALITASARSCFSVLQKIAEEDPDFHFSPGIMLSYANRVIHDASLGKIMMTFFLAVIDTNEKRLTYANAGHNPPWLFKKNQSDFSLISLTSSGQRLGEAPDLPYLEEKMIQLDPGDIVFFYTDGLIEGKNTENKMYGKKKMRQILEKTLSQSIENSLNELVLDFDEFRNGKGLEDDVTIAICQIKESNKTDISQTLPTPEYAENFT